MRLSSLLLLLFALAGLSACSQLSPRPQPDAAPAAGLESESQHIATEHEPPFSEPQPNRDPNLVLARAGTALPGPSPATVSDALSGTAASADQEAPAPADLWQRMRSQFALQGYTHKRVRPHLNWYVRHDHYLDRVAERAEPFLHLIVEEVERRNIPGEVALLPVVESAFQPFAYSHGRAAGIWQFIPGTGRRFGLKQNWWYDGRRDVLAATNAALDYLEYLHRRFDGDWLLALAAYNSGEGTVQRAIRRNLAKGRPTTFWHLDLPRETEAYVPKLLALSAIVATPEAFDISLAPMADEPRVRVVDVGGQMDLALAADMAGMEIEDLYRLNPGFNRWATDPEGPHYLLLPVELSEAFEQRLAELPPDQRLRWERYRIRNGDSLIAIAKRYRTTPKMLRQVNNLRGNTIVAGKHLLIPVASKSFQAYSLTAEQRNAALRQTDRAGEKIEHVVRNGDTFWDISRRYGVSVTKLARWNGMAPRDVLRAGQKLVVWTSKGENGADNNQAGLIPVAHKLPTAATVRTVRYTVRRGDSLSRIASRFRVSVKDLRRWNGLRKGGYLQPGQRLKLYVDVTRQSGSG